MAEPNRTKQLKMLVTEDRQGVELQQEAVQGLWYLLMGFSL